MRARSKGSSKYIQNLSQGDETDHGGSDKLEERSDKPTHQLLVALHPWDVCWIGLSRSTFDCGLKSLCKVRFIAVDQIEELIAAQKGHDLHLLQDVVVFGKFDGDEQHDVGKSNSKNGGNRGDRENGNDV